MTFNRMIYQFSYLFNTILIFSVISVFIFDSISLLFLTSIFMSSDLSLLLKLVLLGFKCLVILLNSLSFGFLIIYDLSSPNFLYTKPFSRTLFFYHRTVSLTSYLATLVLAVLNHNLLFDIFVEFIFEF